MKAHDYTHLQVWLEAARSAEERQRIASALREAHQTFSNLFTFLRETPQGSAYWATLMSNLRELIQYTQDCPEPDRIYIPHSGTYILNKERGLCNSLEVPLLPVEDTIRLAKKVLAEVPPTKTPLIP